MELGAVVLGPFIPIVLALLAPSVGAARTSAEVMVEVVAGLDGAVVDEGIADVRSSGSSVRSIGVPGPRRLGRTNGCALRACSWSGTPPVCGQRDKSLISGTVDVAGVRAGGGCRLTCRARADSPARGRFAKDCRSRKAVSGSQFFGLYHSGLSSGRSSESASGPSMWEHREHMCFVRRRSRSLFSCLTIRGVTTSTTNTRMCHVGRCRAYAIPPAPRSP
jgi:hypothetical protein